MSGSITVGGKILASHDNVSGKLSMSGDVVFPAGHVINFTRKQIVPVDFSGGAYIPRDNTLPQITEGGQVVQYDYVPKDISGSSKLLIQANFWMGERDNVTNKFTAALFINDTCVNVQSHGAPDSAAHFSVFYFQHYLTHSGSSADIEIRADNQSSVSVNPQSQSAVYGTLYTSGFSAYGGSVSNSELIVWEIQ